MAQAHSWGTSMKLTDPPATPGLTRRDLFRPYTYGGAGTDTLTAWMDDEDEPELGRPPGRPRAAECGTPAAYRNHYRDGEKPCRACRDEYNRAQRERAALRATEKD